MRQVLIEARIVEANDTFGRTSASSSACRLRGLRGGTPATASAATAGVAVGGNLQRRRRSDRQVGAPVTYGRHQLRQPAGRPA